MSRRARKRVSPNRAKKVWASLVLSMSLVGGGLAMLVDGTSAPSGLTLSPMVAVVGGGMESIFRTNAEITPGRWDSIIIYHSASPYGTPTSLESRQRELTRQGMGFHFLIGNGAGMGDGDIHVGYRWMDQDSGLHSVGQSAQVDARNAVGICLIGDGNRRPFTRMQVQRLAELVGTLTRELGVDLERVYLQSDLAETGSPGRYFSESQFRELLAGQR